MLSSRGLLSRNSRNGDVILVENYETLHFLCKLYSSWIYANFAKTCDESEWINTFSEQTCFVSATNQLGVGLALHISTVWILYIDSILFCLSFDVKLHSCSAGRSCVECLELAEEFFCITSGEDDNIYHFTIPSNIWFWDAPAWNLAI